MRSARGTPAHASPPCLLHTLPQVADYYVSYATRSTRNASVWDLLYTCAQEGCSAQGAFSSPSVSHNSATDLGFARAMTARALKYSALLGVDGDKRAAWLDLHDNLADYPMTTNPATGNAVISQVRACERACVRACVRAFVVAGRDGACTALVRAARAHSPQHYARRSTERATARRTRSRGRSAASTTTVRSSTSANARRQSAPHRCAQRRGARARPPPTPRSSFYSPPGNARYPIVYFGPVRACERERRRARGPRRCVCSSLPLALPALHPTHPQMHPSEQVSLSAEPALLAAARETVDAVNAINNWIA